MAEQVKSGSSSEGQNKAGVREHKAATSAQILGGLTCVPKDQRQAVEIRTAYLNQRAIDASVPMMQMR